MKQIYWPGQQITLELKRLNPKTGSVRCYEKDFEVIRHYKGGFAGCGWELKEIGSQERFFLKVYKPFWVKRIVRDCMRRIVSQDRAWSEPEVQTAILARKILGRVTQVFAPTLHDGVTLKNKPLIIPAADYSYAWIPEYRAYAMLMPFIDFEPMPFGVYCGESREEVQRRIGFMRRLYNLFDKIGAYGYKSQVMVGKREPVSWKYIYVAALMTVAVLVLSLLLPQISWVWTLIVAYFFYYYSANSWFSLPNVVRDQGDNLLKLLDADVGLPHIIIFWPTAILWIGSMLGLSSFFNLSTEVTWFLIILGSPGYLLLYEWNLCWQNFKVGFLAPLNRIDIQRLKSFIDDHLEQFREVLNDDQIHDLVLYMETLERIQNKFESSRLDIVTRLARILRNQLSFIFGPKVTAQSFSLKEYRLENITWWRQTKQITNNFSQVISSSTKDYLIYIANCYMPIFISMAFMLLNVEMGLVLLCISVMFLRRWKKWLGNENIRALAYALTQNKKYRYTLWMAYKRYKMKELQCERRIPKDYWQGTRIEIIMLIVHVCARKLIPAKLHRLMTDASYRAYVLLYAITFNKNILRRLAARRFIDYLKRERRANNINDEIYHELLPLKNNPKINGYVTLQFLIFAPKVVTVPAKLGLLGGIFATGGVDMIPGLPGWLVGVLALIGASALFKGTLVLIIARIFNFKFSETMLLFSIIILPLGSYYAIPLSLEIKSRWRHFVLKEAKPPYVSVFWRLFGVRWQSLCSKVAGFIGLGSAGEGTIFQVYFRMLLSDTPIGVVRRLAKR